MKLINQGNPEGRVLQAGIDSLALSVYCEWLKDNDNKDVKTFIEKLKHLKQIAIESKAKTTGVIKERYSAGGWLFIIQEKGLRGYNFY